MTPEPETAHAALDPTVSRDLVERIEQPADGWEAGEERGEPADDRSARG